MADFHTSVLLHEAIEYLNVRSGKKYIDATLGGGGHTLEVLQKGGVVLGVDQDSDALEYVKENFQFKIFNFQKKVILKRGNFRDIKKLAQENNFNPVAGVLFDLGVSSYQFDTTERGFSFSRDALLDMRMDKNLSVTAEDLVNGLMKGEMLELLEKLGEETNARKIVSAILTAREKKRVQTTKELAEIIERVSLRKPGQIHPATKVFQALRIAVNDELNSLREALPQAVGLLAPKGRLVVIAFHSLEDRIVKHAFLGFEEQELGGILNKKPIMAGEEEIERNPRSRSAKMRVFEKR